MNDSSTTIEELKTLVKQFRDERDWEQFHDPKNLTEALSIEVSELLEHFLWKDKAQVAEALQEETFREEVGDELADVFNYTLLLSIALKMDLVEVSKRKIEKTKIKYPVEKSKGRATKYTKL